MIIILNGIFLVIYLVYLILKKNISFYSISILGITAVLFIIQIINFATQTKAFSLSEKTFKHISEIDWKNENTLHNIGFSKHNEYHISHYDSDDYLCSIVVQKTENIPKNLKYTDGIGYKIYEERNGIFSFQRISSSESSVIRRYFIYVDDIIIKVTEDNVEDSPLVFPQFIEEISKK